MDTIKFDTLKNKVKFEFIRQLRSFLKPDWLAEMQKISLEKMIKEGRPRTYNQTLREVEENVLKAIDLTDVRSYNDLMKIAPKAFPSWITKKECSLEYDENGDWVFVRLYKSF